MEKLYLRLLIMEILLKSQKTHKSLDIYLRDGI